jgi:hypothetical protein
MVAGADGQSMRLAITGKNPHLVHALLSEAN